MTTKQWLLRARKMENRLASLEAARQQAYDRAISSTTRPKEVNVKGGGSVDNNAAYVIAGESVKEQLDKLQRVKAEIRAAINAVDDAVLATLLTEYYINGRTWEQVTESVSRVKRKYSTDYVRKELHAQALWKIAQHLVVASAKV